LEQVMHKTLTLMFGLVLAGLLANQSAFAQEEPAKPAAVDSSDAPEADTKKYHRLPPFYGDVVTEKQKEQIYAIQDRYGAEIRTLELQLLAVIKKRNAEVEMVLTAQQKTLVVRLAEEAKKQRDRLKAIRDQIEAARDKADTTSDTP